MASPQIASLEFPLSPSSSSPPLPFGSDPGGGGDSVLLAASTVLNFPFPWATPTEAEVQTFLKPLLSRKYFLRDGTRRHLWHSLRQGPSQIKEMDRRFQSQLGFELKSKMGVKFNNNNIHVSIPIDKAKSSVRNGATASKNHPYRLVLDAEVLKELFEFSTMEASSDLFDDYDPSGPPTRTIRVQVETVVLILFPLGSGMTQFLLNWLPEDNQSKLRLFEFRSWLFASKFRGIKESVFQGWHVGMKKRIKDWRNQFSPKHAKYLGERMGDIFPKKTSLGEISLWLICRNVENFDKNVFSFGQEMSKRGLHVTAVTTDRPLTNSTLQAYLFYLRRAKAYTTSAIGGNLDRVLPLRVNRYIGVSREGSVSISWPHTKKGGNRKVDRPAIMSEVLEWHNHFIGIYKVLTVFVYGEKSTLTELSYLSATAADLLTVVTGSKLALDNMAKARKELIMLASLMARYTLQMSSDDCGGLSDYVEYFACLKDVFKIRDTRKELQEELQNVLKLVESNFYQEERAMRKHLAVASRIKRNRGERFNVFVGVLSALALPVVIISGMFGMNNNDLPASTSWFTLMLIALGISVFILLVFVDPLELFEKLNSVKGRRADIEASLVSDSSDSRDDSSSSSEEN